MLVSTTHRVLLAFALATVASAASFSVSNSISSGMVFQRDAPIAVWGFATPGAAVLGSMTGVPSNATITGPDGVWRLWFPPLPASVTPLNVTLTCGSNSIELTDVLVGDVILCSGQSNQALSLAMGLNATAELAASDAFGPFIRILYVAGTSAASPAIDIQTPAIPWARASAAVMGQSSWAGFSAQCWFTGRDLFEALGVPVGLVESCVGGTAIRQWTPTSGLAKCAQPYNSPAPYGIAPYGHSLLYNGMIAPFTTGPTRFRFVLWDQAESDSFPQTPVGYYGCQTVAQINSWRANFQDPLLPWIFLHLQPYTGADPCCLADLRAGQLSALLLPNTGYATALDLGDPDSPWGNVHFRNKQAAAGRIVQAALSVAYGQVSKYPPPAFLEQTAFNSTTIAVSFDTASANLTLLPAASVPCSPAITNATQCTSFELFGSDGNRYPATAVLSDVVLLLSAALPSGVYAVGTAYGWSMWPRVLLYDTNTGLPILPWNQALTLAGPPGDQWVS